MNRKVKHKDPKITLVSWTQEPVKAIASQIKNMFGEMVHDLDEIDYDEAVEMLQELKKTGLGGALEVVDFIFQIENVPRSFTHQLVRNRVGATYHQESLRFSTREDGFDMDIPVSVRTEGKNLDMMLDGMDEVADLYKDLVDSGVPMQDARGVLPINVLTSIGFKVNFKTLINIAAVRLCHQSQPHWFKIVTMMKNEIARKVDPVLADFLVVACERTGRCEYKAVFDRKCPKEKQLIDRHCQACSLYQKSRCPMRETGEYCGAMKNLMRL